MFALSRLSIWAAVGGLVILGGYGLPVGGEEPVQVRGRSVLTRPSSPRSATSASSLSTSRTAAIATSTS